MKPEEKQGKNIMVFISLLFKYWLLFALLSAGMYVVVFIVFPEIRFISVGTFLFFFVIGLFVVGRVLSQLFNLGDTPPLL